MTDPQPLNLEQIRRDLDDCGRFRDAVSLGRIADQLIAEIERLRTERTHPMPDYPECEDCGAVNHGNATCATCVRTWDCSEETRRMVLDAIARGSRDTADA